VKRVLVTGATGFVGRHVVQPLEGLGFEVCGAGSGDDLLTSGAARRLLGKAKPSYLIHLAWASSAARMRSVEENAAWQQASVDLFEAFADVGGTRAVFAGTCAEYDWSHERLVEDETPLKPRTPYGTSKNATREAVSAMAATRGVSVAWARLFFLYGPHEPRGRLVSDLCESLLAEREIELTAGLQERDYMHVEDAGAALAALLASDFSGAINVATGSAASVRSIAIKLAGLTKGERFLQFGRRPSPPDDPPRLVGDTTRLKRELLFKPRYGLEEGLVQTLDWWRTSFCR
jgi:nucleoside-diphosphate-sugar epimerase